MINLMDLFMKRFKKEKKTSDAPHSKIPEESREKTSRPRYVKLVEEIDRMVEEGEICRLSKQEGPKMITYFDGKRKIMNINKNSDPPRTYFLFSGARHKARELDAEGLRPVSKNEAKQKRYGPVKALYTGSDPQIIKSMLKGLK